MQDFLPAVAAGNLGYLDEDTTIGSPAVAKNALTVGKQAAIIELCMPPVLGTGLRRHGSRHPP